MFLFRHTDIITSTASFKRSTVSPTTTSTKQDDNQNNQNFDLWETLLGGNYQTNEFELENENLEEGEISDNFVEPNLTTNANNKDEENCELKQFHQACLQIEAHHFEKFQTLDQWTDLEYQVQSFVAR